MGYAGFGPMRAAITARYDDRSATPQQAAAAIAALPAGVRATLLTDTLRVFVDAHIERTGRTERT